MGGSYTGRLENGRQDIAAWPEQLARGGRRGGAQHPNALITQNRMAALADKRAELDLQVSLLAEHEITRLLTLVTAMAEHMGLEVAQDPELAELSQDVAPEKVMEKMEADERAIGDRSGTR